jgi:cysteine-rich repeat protein
MLAVRISGLLVFVLSGLAGCSDRDPPDTDPIGGSGGSTSDGPGGDGGSGGSAPITCHVDYPCFDRTAQCSTTERVTAMQTVSCSVDCGDQPCSGGSCRPVGSGFDCPAGTVCRDVPHLATQTAACVDATGVGGSTGGPMVGPWAGDCGNARLDNVELCDDGNQASGDGCSQYCTRETDWRCGEPGQACQSVYGDGACSGSACRLGDTCVDQPSSVACACPSDELPACPQLRLLGLSLPEDATDCSAIAISADATTIVGACTIRDGAIADGRSARSQAVKWTATGAVQRYPVEGSSIAFGVNADGSVIVGRDPEGPFVWQPTAVVHLGVDLGVAVSTSADGSVVVGGGGAAFVWTADAGARSLPPAQLGRSSTASRVSADGTLIIGFESDDRGVAALTWSLDGQVRVLAGPPNATSVEPRALSRDGSVIAGNVWLAADKDSRAVRWTSAGIEIIGPTGSFARAISADGSAIVGSIGSDSVVWNAALSVERLDTLLAAAGANLSGWSLRVTDVSADAKTIVGEAQYLDPRDGRVRGFVAWLP